MTVTLETHYGIVRLKNDEDIDFESLPVAGKVKVFADAFPFEGKPGEVIELEARENKFETLEYLTSLNKYLQNEGFTDRNYPIEIIQKK